MSSHGLRRPPPFKNLPSSVFGGRYSVGRFLGRGASATVWEATHADSHLRVAVKVFDQGARDRRQAAREMKILSRIRHQRILEAFEVVETSLYSHLVCELVDGESLRAHAQRHPGQRLEEGRARQFYRQVVNGVSYCHEHLVVHRDLKLENLLLDRQQENVKVIDFGFAAQVASRETKLRAFCGTPSYMAPEIIRGEGYSGFAADVWALGVVIFALLAAVLPFAGRTEMQLYAKIRRGIYTFPDILGELPRRLVRSVLRMDASTRPPASALLRNAWVVGANPIEEAVQESEPVVESAPAPAAPPTPAPLPAAVAMSPAPLASVALSPVASPPSAGRQVAVTAGADAAGGGSIGARAGSPTARRCDEAPPKGGRHSLPGSGGLRDASAERPRASPEKRRASFAGPRDPSAERPARLCHETLPTKGRQSLGGCGGLRDASAERPRPSMASPMKTGFGSPVSMKIAADVHHRRHGEGGHHLRRLSSAAEKEHVAWLLTQRELREQGPGGGGYGHNGQLRCCPPGMALGGS